MRSASTDRVEVRQERAELVGRAREYREQFELVTARSFAEPAVTAEIAAGLVAVGGILVVSEPPEPDGAAWPARAVRAGIRPRRARVAAADAHFVVLAQGRRPCAATAVSPSARRASGQAPTCGDTWSRCFT